MELICEQSLSATLNAINLAHFFDAIISRRQREEAANFIASRQAQPRAYAGTFALFRDELENGIRLFTGELVTAAAARHIAGEEACRALKFLAATSKKAGAALEAAMTALANCVGPAAPTDPRNPDDPRLFWNWEYRGGTYCCGKCSVALWRNILAGNFSEPETRLARGLECLQKHRTADHQWRRFPFWYTTSALLEMPASHAALDEIRHAAPRLGDALKRKADAKYGPLRQEIARRLLAFL